MRKIIFIVVTTFTFSYAVVLPQTNFVGDSVVPADKTYYKHTQDNIEIIHTKDNLEFAKHTAKIEPSLHRNYELFYGWKFDEKLSIGLISDQNQIANGFSTQLPNNRQINYLGGTSKVDYFTSTSWLDTLLYHETAHNYQVNVKASAVSQSLHSAFGNGFFFIPLFTVPNYAENSFMLEGNAVLNESWHGNGGRLYSGRLKAQTILQAKAGNIKAGEVYNIKLAFPYGEIRYIQGGFYNYYLAQNYGLHNTNSYFKHHSQDWFWPFFTNASMTQAVGIDFEHSLLDFEKEYASKELVLAEGEHIASSQVFYQLNSDAQEIYFLTNETGRRAPELLKLNKVSQEISQKRASWSGGKVIKIDKHYYTQASSYISASQRMQGLFDKDKFIKEGSASKMVQGYLSDARAVYFDVSSSFSQPQLYLGDEFYAQVNSSVHIDKDDNLYYFKQKDKTRTLYKNKTPLFSMQGFYGFVNDVDTQGGIYFTANTKNGSSLFKYRDEKVIRVSNADNILEARLINDKQVLLAAISEKDYYYVKTTLQDIQDTPFDVKLFFEEKDYYAKNKQESRALSELPDLSIKYNSFTDMKYSGVDFMYGASTDGTDIWQINLKFADPLTQNAINMYLNKDINNVTIAGAGYNSALSIVKYGLYAYGVVQSAYEVRDGGVISYASVPLYKNGYYESDFTVSYYEDYDTIDRKPLSIQVNVLRSEQFAYSMFENYLNGLNLYTAIDRQDFIYGGEYNFQDDLGYEFYLSLNLKYSQTKSTILNASTQKRGVKVSTSSYSSDLDPSLIDMKSIDANLYIKGAGYADIGLAKVLNFSSYWFTFPLSLQRETLYAKYKYFDLEGFSGIKVDAQEVTLGFSASVILFNNVVLPLGFEYLYNDNRLLSQDESKIFFTLGSSF